MTHSDNLLFKLKNFIQSLDNKIYIDLELLQNARVHASWAYESGVKSNNERLEFLGDGILHHIISAYLYLNNPYASPGELTDARQQYVSKKALSDIAQEYNLGQYILLGKGEKLSFGHKKPKLLEDFLEALIGAVYLSALKAAQNAKSSEISNKNAACPAAKPLPQNRRGAFPADKASQNISPEQNAKRFIYALYNLKDSYGVF